MEDDNNPILTSSGKRTKKRVWKLCILIVVVMIMVIGILIVIRVCRMSCMNREIAQTVMNLQNAPYRSGDIDYNQVLVREQLCLLGEKGYTLYLFGANNEKPIMTSQKTFFIKMEHNNLDQVFMGDENCFAENVMATLASSYDHKDNFVETKMKENTNDVASMHESYQMQIKRFYLQGVNFLPVEYEVLKIQFYSRYNDSRAFFDQSVECIYNKDIDDIIAEYGEDSTDLLINAEEEGYKLSENPYCIGTPQNKMIDAGRKGGKETEVDLENAFDNEGDEMRLVIYR